jgi:diguanylate cyclase (GGDEF)-like protein
MQKSDAPKLAILDWMMPGIEGVEICRKLRENKKNEEQYTYLILLTSKRSKENIVSGMEAGADDYVVKPFDQHELRVRIRAGQRIVQLQSELLVAKQDLLIQSRTDSLTGVLNRRAILSQIETELSRAKREKKDLSLSILDIDHFKKINDTYGHMVGDDVIREVVKRISVAVRTYDSLGRFGGEEFLVVMPGAKELEAYSICERIRSAINVKDFAINGLKIHLTVSLGFVTGDGNTDIDDLIVRADKALYQAKGNGRNRTAQTLTE